MTVRLIQIVVREASYHYAVSDFLAVFDAQVDATVVGDLLRDRPHLTSRPIVSQRFRWGSVFVQPSADPAYAPHVTSAGAFHFSVGRPLITGPSTPPNVGLMETIAGEWNRNLTSLWQKLSGVFVIGRGDDKSLMLLTDPMGVRPVYVARNASGAIVAVGSSVPSLAVISGLQGTFDAVSLAELLVFSVITFPFTSHDGILELAPASTNAFVPASSGVQHTSTILWQPEEREDPFAPLDLSEELEDAMRVAAREMTAGVDSVALTLSGGRDSRAVLAALPLDKRHGAITYVTRWNRETEVAQRVAAAAGVPHHSAMRPSDFYERLMERTVALQGTEQRGQAHGLCIPDSGLHEQFDLIIGGQFADTYLKDHFMPPWLRACAAGSGPFGALHRTLARARSLTMRRPGTLAWLQNHKLLASIRSPLAEAVRARHEQRLRDVERIRPVTAAEWIAIWPSSRRYAAASHVQGNSRVFGSDTLYTHRRVVDVAVRVPLRERIDGALANRTFQMLYGPVLGGLEDANTGLPANAGAAAENEAARRRRKEGPSAEFRRLDASDAPWNDGQSSWADMKILQQRSQHWITMRTRLQHSPALDVLATVLRRSPIELMQGYDSQLPFGFNMMAVQLAHYVQRMTHAPGAAAAKG